MGLFKRAGLYIIRKKYTNMLLFIFFLFLSSFILTGAAVVNYSSNTVAFLRKITGASFRIAGNVTETVDKNAQIDFKTNTIDIEDVKFIQEMEGINQYNYQATVKIMSTNIDFIAIDNNYDNSGLAISNTNSELNDYFQKGYLKLIQGTHIVENEKEKVLISKQLANENELTIGDNIELFIFKGEENLEKSKVNGVVGGIFDPRDGINEIISDVIAVENMIFVEQSLINKISYLEKPNYNEVVFFLEDPIDFEHIINEVSKTIDASKYIIIGDTDKYKKIEEHLIKYQGIIYIFIFICIIASLVILILLLIFRINSRKQEIGVLLAIGTQKISIIMQFFLEVTIINMITYFISIFISNYFANNISKVLFNGIEEYKSIGMDKAIYTYIFLAINVSIFLSVIFSSLKIIKYEPKKILSDMS